VLRLPLGSSSPLAFIIPRIFFFLPAYAYVLQLTIITDSSVSNNFFGGSWVENYFRKMLSENGLTILTPREYYTDLQIVCIPIDVKK